MKNPIAQRRLALQAGLALGAAALMPRARACEFFTTQLRIVHPWTRAGNGPTSAAICMVFDDVTEGDRLIGVETPIAAGAELHGAAVGSRPVDFKIPAGRVTQFTEAGTHVRLTGLNTPLQLAREYPMWLVFEKGGRVQVDLSVDFDRTG